MKRTLTLIIPISELKAQKAKYPCAEGESYDSSNNPHRRRIIKIIIAPKVTHLQFAGDVGQGSAKDYIYQLKDYGYQEARSIFIKIDVPGETVPSVYPDNVYGSTSWSGSQLVQKDCLIEKIMSADGIEISERKWLAGKIYLDEVLPAYEGFATVRKSFLQLGFGRDWKEVAERPRTLAPSRISLRNDKG